MHNRVCFDPLNDIVVFKLVHVAKYLVWEAAIV